MSEETDTTTWWRHLPLVLVRATSLDDLPEALTADILSRLPVKTLISSTAVNKSWYSLITNPNFISAHTNRSINNINDHFVLMIPEAITPRNPCSLISEENDYSLCEKIKIPFTTKSNAVRVIGSSNGLVCVSDIMPTRGRDLYLWNPVARKYRALLSSCFKAHKLCGWTTYAVIGFGFCKRDDDYRVVRILYFCDDEREYFGKLAPKVEVFSLKRGTWKRVKDGNVSRLVNQESFGFVDGKCYWAEAIVPVEYPASMWVLSFDFGDEVFGEIKCPDGLLDWVGLDASVLVLNYKGLVSLCALALTDEATQRCCLWVMRHEDGGPVAWTKQFKVEMNQGIGQPLGFTKSEKLIIASANSDFKMNDLVSCDLKSLQFKVLGKDGQYGVDVDFIESLALVKGRNVLLEAQY